MKRAMILATKEFIGSICKQSGKQTLSVNSPIPEDAEFIDARFSFERQAFMICFEHESFDDIPEGLELPILDNPEFTKYMENR